jgi:DNA-binding transcriptional regulator YhcF (GntR family)
MMKIKLMQTIYASNLKSRAILVMNYLIFRANKEGTCFPSIKTIAKECHISVNTVKRALDDLIRAGYVQKDARFIEKKNGAQTSNLYTLSAGMFVADDIDAAEAGTAINTVPASCQDEPIEQISFENMAPAVLQGKEEAADQPIQGEHEPIISNSYIPVHIEKTGFSEYPKYGFKWAAPQPMLIPP